jgi:hypothetical protein
MTFRVLFLTGVVTILFGESVHADNLPGSAVSLKEAAGKADAVFVGEVSNVGPSGFPTDGASGYFGNQVRVTKKLAGHVGRLIAVSFYTREGSGEEAPEAGSSYIFFVMRNKSSDLDPWTAFKIVPYTEDERAEVRQMVGTDRSHLDRLGKKTE